MTGMSEDTVVLGSSRAGDDEVREYVAQVRRALADLGPDDLDELTLGMEADLAEIRSEGGPLATRLGSPDAYAAELRTAAGLPPRPAATRGARLRAARTGIRERYEETARRHPWVRATGDYVATLRPAWWLLRAFLAAWLGTGVLGGGPALGMLLVVLFVPVSVLLGLRRPTLPVAARRTVAALNTLGAVVALVFGVQVVDHFLGRYSMPPVYVDAGAPAAPSGLSIDGEPVRTLYVYDEQGRPVPRARLVAPGGRNLVPAEDDDGRQPVPGVDIYGRTYPNVFPVQLPGQDPWHPAPTESDIAGGETPWAPPASQPPLAPPTTPTPTTAPGPVASTTIPTHPTSTPGTATPAPPPTATPTAPRTGTTTVAPTVTPTPGPTR